jgi:PII-like signaling protein
VTGQGLKLTAYFGERDLAGNRLLADELGDLFARRGVGRSLLLRGMEGFGPRQLLHTDRLLTLSEDLPLVAIALGEGEQIRALAADVRALRFDGLVTLERIAVAAGGLAVADVPAYDVETKLTIHLGRHDRAERAPAHRAVVDTLHAQGVAGATVLLGVDGTAAGTRQRARLIARNDRVPAMIVSVGEGARIAAALERLRALVPHAVATVERVRVLRRDGVALAPLQQPPPGDWWQKVTVYAGTQSRHDDEVLHGALMQRLRGARAAGATTLRGVWGYHGDHAPHGDVAWRLRRRVPVVTTAVDRPAALRSWWPVVEEVTAQTGLVTDELVPVALPAPRG